MKQSLKHLEWEINELLGRSDLTEDDLGKLIDLSVAYNKLEEEENGETRQEASKENDERDEASSSSQAS